VWEAKVWSTKEQRHVISNTYYTRGFIKTFHPFLFALYYFFWSQTDCDNIWQNVIEEQLRHSQNNSNHYSKCSMCFFFVGFHTRLLRHWSIASSMTDCCIPDLTYRLLP